MYISLTPSPIKHNNVRFSVIQIVTFLSVPDRVLEFLCFVSAFSRREQAMDVPVDMYIQLKCYTLQDIENSTHMKRTLFNLFTDAAICSVEKPIRTIEQYHFTSGIKITSVGMPWVLQKVLEHKLRMATMVMSQFRHMTTSFFHCTPLLIIAVQAKSMQCVGSKPFVIVANYCIHWLSKGVKRQNSMSRGNFSMCTSMHR